MGELEEKIDFEGTEQKPNDGALKQEDVQSLNGDDVEALDNKNQQNQENQKSEEIDENEVDVLSDIAEGDVFEYNGEKLTVDANGNLVKEDGSVAVEADKVDDFLNELTPTEEEENALTIENFKDAFGVDIVDENNEPIEFDNTPKGIADYVEAVVNTRVEDIQQKALDDWFAQNPMVKEFMDYVTINGSPIGFGEIPDRSQIVLNKDNEFQLEQVIRYAAKEFGNTSISDNYIKYLKDNGGLYQEAKRQLDALVEKDKDTREQNALEAERIRQQELEETAAYKEEIRNAISNRKIGDLFTIPESFTKNINGKDYILTPRDFYRYVTEQTAIDEDGNSVTRYAQDRNNMSDEETLQKDLLDAWLLFTGCTYSDLINNVARETNVRQLKAKSRSMRTPRYVKLNKPSKSNNNTDDIIL